MSKWVDVAAVYDLTPGNRRVVDVDGVAVAVFNVDGEYFAIRDACSHDGGILSNGTVEDDVIVCPRHGARFSIRTGAVLGPPAYEDLEIFFVRVIQGRVQIEI
jgi:3-phenylpropionate/trans-cinnamate dioxygenase ferredoxin component